MPFQDRTLSCSDCHKEFIFTAGEQEFFQSRGFSNIPKRCEDCRSKRKAEFSGGGERPRPGASFQKQKSSSGHRTERTKFPTTCSRCGVNFDAPFEPKDGRPVFCRDCFNASRSR